MAKAIAEGKSDKTLTFRLNAAQRDALIKQAKKHNMSQACYIMHLVEKDILNENKN